MRVLETIEKIGVLISTLRVRSMLNIISTQRIGMRAG